MTRSVAQEAYHCVITYVKLRLRPKVWSTILLRSKASPMQLKHSILGRERIVLTKSKILFVLQNCKEMGCLEPIYCTSHHPDATWQPSHPGLSSSRTRSSPFEAG